MSIKKIEEKEEGNKGPPAKSEEEEAYFNPENFSAEMMDESEWEERNAFRWSFLQTSDVPSEGVEAVIAGPPFMKDDEGYTGEEGKSPYLPVLLEGNLSRSFIMRLSSTRLISLKETMACSLEELPGKKVKIEHKEFGNGTGLEFTEKMGLAEKRVLDEIQHRIEVDDPDHKEGYDHGFEDLDHGEDWGNKEVNGEE